MPMVLKRKRKREYYKDFKIVRGVFDERTLLVLYRLLNRKKISVKSLIKEGKESIILSGLIKNKEWVAIKVYRTGASNFKTIWKYLIGDPRFHSISKKRRIIVNLWCQREFKNLKIAYEANVNSPKPLFFDENILIMSFIGEDGLAAPRLIDIKPDNPKELYKLVLNNLKKLVKAGLIHGDLSAYNILLSDEPYFIDFSHGTTLKSQLASEMLKRDIKNVNSYFSKLNIPLKDPKKIYKGLNQIIKEKVNK
jgi:RIO kinase 1